MFESKGYLETNVHDISSAAGVAYGTFYIYFASREEIFAELVKVHMQRFREIAASEPSTGVRPADLIERANRGFLRAYRETAAMQGLVEQVATFDPQQALKRRQSNHYFRERARRAITSWQIDGLVPRDIDAVYAASALGALVDRSAYLWFVLGEEHDFDVAVEQLTHLYCGALGLEHSFEKDRPVDDR